MLRIRVPLDRLRIAEGLLQTLEPNRFPGEELSHVEEAFLGDVGVHVEADLKLEHEGVDGELVPESTRGEREEDGAVVRARNFEGDASRSV